MTSDVDIRTIKATQELLVKVIKKPILTEKLLKRPPFRFLHDIITNIIKTNGFMKGLYNEQELNAENIKDKEAKILFLQKAIDMTGFVIEDVIAARPSKIVAGLEADKTNQWLQALARAAINKNDYVEAVQKVLNGEKPTKSGQKSVHQTSAGKKSEVNGSSKTMTKSKTNTKNRDKNKSSDRRAETKGPSSRNDSALSKKNDQIESEARKTVSTHKLNDESDPNNYTSKPSSAGDEKEILNKIVSDNKETHEMNEIVNGKATNEELSRISHDSNAHVQQRSAAKSAMRGAPGVTPTNATRANVNANVNAPAEGARNQIKSAVPRPSSARPAPPKVVLKRELEEEKIAAEMEEKMRLQSVKPVENLIVEKSTVEEEDETDFIVNDSIRTTDDELINNEQLTIDSVSDNQKGSLVKQLMDTKRELEGEQRLESGSKVITKLAVRDIEKLRQSIQTLSRSVNPLGRVLDYLQEDIDVMLAELKSWAEEYKRNMIILEKERNAIDQASEPLQGQLNLLDRDIEEQKEKISITKANINRNEERLLKMFVMISKT